MTKKQIIEDAKDLILIVKEASAAILDIYYSNSYSIEKKDDDSPLTLADRVSNKIITDALKKYGLPILSEEGTEILYNEREHWGLYWLIDPIDGTKEFINKNGEFTVNIALMDKTKPVFGLVGVPIADEIYVGGETVPGYYLKDDIKIELTPKDKNTCNNIIVASKSHLNTETEAYIASVNDASIIRVGSSLKFMMIARNKASVYPRFGPTMEWDIAASHAILLSLGYSITSTRGKKIEYNKENLLNPFFIAN